MEPKEVFRHISKTSFFLTLQVICGEREKNETGGPPYALENEQKVIKITETHQAFRSTFEIPPHVKLIAQSFNFPLTIRNTKLKRNSAHIIVRFHIHIKNSYRLYDLVVAEPVSNQYYSSEQCNTRFT